MKTHFTFVVNQNTYDVLFDKGRILSVVRYMEDSGQQRSLLFSELPKDVQRKITDTLGEIYGN